MAEQLTRVKMTQAVYIVHLQRMCKSGDVIDVPTAMANQWVGTGIAELEAADAKSLPTKPAIVSPQEKK